MPCWRRCSHSSIEKRSARAGSDGPPPLDASDLSGHGAGIGHGPVEIVTTGPAMEAAIGTNIATVGVIAVTAGAIADIAGAIADIAGAIADTAGSIADIAGSIVATATGTT